MKRLKEQFNKITEEYLSSFSKKHDLEFDGWVGDRIGEIATFGDYFFNFDDIRYDLDNDIQKEIIFEWYDISIDLALSDKPVVNYRDFVKLNT